MKLGSEERESKVKCLFV